MNPIRSSHPNEAALEKLHNRFCQLTGRTETYALAQRDWYEWSQYFKEQDLETVIAYVLRENQKRNKQFLIRTELRKLIGDLQLFDSLKATAEQEQRAKAARARAYQPSQGEKELAAMRHEQVVPPETPAKKVDMDFVIESIKSMRKAVE